MKKLIIASLALCLVLAACNRNKPASTTTEATTEKEITIPVATTTEPVTTEPVEVTSEAPYTAVKETPEYGNGVTVEYDVLKLDDEELNDLLKAEADTELARHIPNISSITEDGGTADYYSIMSNLYDGERLISAVFNGAYSVSYGTGAASESRGTVLYTVNIDKQNGKLLDGDDIISDFDALKTAFYDGEFSPQGAEPFASDLTQYRTEYGIYPYVSIDENNFYLYVFETGAAEFYTVYSISLEAAKDFLNKEYYPAAE